MEFLVDIDTSYVEVMMRERQELMEFTSVTGQDNVGKGNSPFLGIRVGKWLLTFI